MTVCFLGDDFVCGIGDPASKGWMRRVTDGWSIDHINYAQQGATSRDMPAQIEAAMAGQTPSGFVFCFAANDCLLSENRKPRVGQLERLKNTKAALMKAKAYGPTLLVSPFPIAGNDKATACIADTARQFAVIARANGVPYVNIFDAVCISPVWNKEVKANNGMHPGSEAYTEAAQLVMQDAIWQAWVAALTAVRI